MIDFSPMIKRDRLLWRTTWYIIGGSVCSLVLIGCQAVKEQKLKTVTVQYQKPSLPNATKVEAIETITLTVPQDPVRYANSKRDVMKWEWGYHPANAAYQIWFWKNNEWQFGFYTLTNRCSITNSKVDGFMPFKIVPQDIHGNPGIHIVKNFLPRPL